LYSKNDHGDLINLLNFLCCYISDYQIHNLRVYFVTSSKNLDAYEISSGLFYSANNIATVITYTNNVLNKNPENTVINPCAQSSETNNGEFKPANVLEYNTTNIFILPAGSDTRKVSNTTDILDLVSDVSPYPSEETQLATVAPVLPLDISPTPLVIWNWIKPLTTDTPQDYDKYSSQEQPNNNTAMSGMQPLPFTDILRTTYGPIVYVNFTVVTGDKRLSSAVSYPLVTFKVQHPDYQKVSSLI